MAVVYNSSTHGHNQQCFIYKEFSFTRLNFKYLAKIVLETHSHSGAIFYGIIHATSRKAKYREVLSGVYLKTSMNYKA